MKPVARIAAVLVSACVMPALAAAEPIEIFGSFGIGRPLIGTSAGGASLVWSNPPAGKFESPTRQDVSVVAATWEPRDGFSSTLLGATAPVLPLEPGPVPVGGSFRADGGASFSFEGSTDPTVPFLNQSIDLRFSGGTFNVPAVFPPTDSEGLYILTEPFTMNGTWTVRENETTLFSGELRGAGTAHLVLFGDQRTGNSLISQVFYEFRGSAPVPEPATFAMLGVGAGMLAIRRGRRGQRPRGQA
jgi:hypothetical protein